MSNIAAEAIGGFISPEAAIARAFIDKARAGEFKTRPILVPEGLGEHWQDIVNTVADVYAEAAFDVGGSIEAAMAAVEDIIKILKDDEVFKTVMEYSTIEDLPPIDLKPDAMPPLPEKLSPKHELATAGMQYLLDYVPYGERWAPFAPRIYHVNAALFLISLITARRLVITDQGEPEYTSLYFMFAGESSVGKSASAKKALYVLERLGLQHLILQGEWTPELYKKESAGAVPDEWDDLEYDEQEEEKGRLAWSGKLSMYIDEVGQLFKAWFNPTGPHGQWPKILLEAEDSRIVSEHGSISNGRHKVKDPYLAWLGCLTFSSVKKMPAVLDGFENGFFARIVLCVAPPPPPDQKDIDVRGNIFVPDCLYKGLMDYHKRLRMPHADVIRKEKSKDSETKGSKKYKIEREKFPETTIMLSEEAREYFVNYRAWIIKTGRNKELVPSEIAPNYNRLCVKVLRAAAMLAFYDQYTEIQLCHIHAAIEIAETMWRPSMHSFYEYCFSAAPSHKKVSEDKIFRFIERQSAANRWVSASDIGNWNKIEHDIVSKTLKFLLDENKIQMGKLPPQRKGQGITVKYALPNLDLPKNMVQ